MRTEHQELRTENRELRTDFQEPRSDLPGAIESQFVTHRATPGISRRSCHSERSEAPLPFPAAAAAVPFGSGAVIVILSKRVLRAKDLGEPREASRPLRRNNRAFGSLPYQTAPLPTDSEREVEK